MSDNSGDNPGHRPVGKRKLLEKYDLTIDKLSFEYVRECKTIKELERIYKVLRSNEEGHYAELEKCAEDRLRELAPDSRVLRVEEPALRGEDLPREERDEMERDMENWEKEVNSKDQQLSCCKTQPQDSAIPPIRRVPSSVDKMAKEEVRNNNKKRTNSSYEEWDRYDTDSELLKMDVEEEKKRLAQEKQENARKVEDDRLQTVTKQAETLSEAEQSVLARSEKERGNEYYRVCDFEEAVKYYSASITIQPSAAAYSNRAACYLKLSKFEAALKDTNCCLRLDPANPKGLYRRALCLQHKLRFEEALRDVEAVLKKEPHNVIVRHVADKLRQQCLDMPRRVRMLIEDGCGGKKVVEMSEKEAREVENGYEVNEFGLAKTMCRCYGRPPFLRNPNPTGIADHLLCRTEKEKEEEEKKKKKKEKLESMVADRDDDTEIADPSPRSMKTTTTSRMKITELNDDDLPVTDLTGKTVAKNKIVFAGSEPEEVSKKLRIIEAVKNDDNVTPKNHGGGSIVKDMRSGHGQTDLMEQLSSVTIDEALARGTAAAAEEEERAESSSTRTVVKPDEPSPTTRSPSATSSTNAPRVRNYSFDVPSEKQPIAVANKYRQKVSSNRESVCGMTPFRFLNLWSSMKECSNRLAGCAGLLRQIDPCGLRTLLGNKLDEAMLVLMVNSFSSEFDLLQEPESKLVREYLIALSRVDRFKIVVRFLTPDVKRMIADIVNKCGGEEAANIRASYGLSGA